MSSRTKYVRNPSQHTSSYLDSGATHHVSGDPTVFSTISPTNGTQVCSMGGGQNHNVTGVGDIGIRVSSGSIKRISSVMYTPGITKNLLSVGSLTGQGKTLVFKSQNCFLIDDATQSIEAVAVRERNKGLHKLQANYPCEEPEIHSVHLRSRADLWHKRLGHFHIKGM